MDVEGPFGLVFFEHLLENSKIPAVHKDLKVKGDVFLHLLNLGLLEEHVLLFGHLISVDAGILYVIVYLPDSLVDRITVLKVFVFGFLVKSVEVLVGGDELFGIEVQVFFNF